MLGAGMALAREQWGGSRGCAATSCVVLRELFLMDELVAYTCFQVLFGLGEGVGKLWNIVICGTSVALRAWSEEVQSLLVWRSRSIFQ